MSKGNLSKWIIRKNQKHLNTYSDDECRLFWIKFNMPIIGNDTFKHGMTYRYNENVGK